MFLDAQTIARLAKVCKESRRVCHVEKKFGGETVYQLKIYQWYIFEDFGDRVCRDVLDKIEACPVDADVMKRGVNSWVGTLMIQSDYRYRVFTGSEGMFVPFQWRILRKEAPGGWDHA